MTRQAARDVVLTHDCGWRSPTTTRRLAEKGMRTHSCDRWRRLTERHERGVARMAVIDRTPKACACPRARHRHGTYVTYTVHACRCLPCVAAATGYERQRVRQRAYGRAAYIDAAPVRAHVEELQRTGMGWKRVAAAAGLSPSVLWKLLYGDPSRNLQPSKRVREQTAAKILAVDAAEDLLSGGALVDATETRRRLQALVALGWSQSQIADRLHMERGNFGRTLSSDRVRVSTVRATRALYRVLRSTPPPEETHSQKISAARARNYAAARGWMPPPPIIPPPVQTAGSGPYGWLGGVVQREREMAS